MAKESPGADALDDNYIVSVSDSQQEAAGCREESGSVIVLKVHERELCNGHMPSDTQETSQNMLERADSPNSSESDDVFTTEDDEEIEAQLALYNSCGEESAKDFGSSDREPNLSKVNIRDNKQPLPKMSVSALHRSTVAAPRRPCKSNSVAYSLNSDRRRIFSAEAKVLRNDEFSGSLSPEREGRRTSPTKKNTDVMKYEQPRQTSHENDSITRKDDNLFKTNSVTNLPVAQPTPLIYIPPVVLDCPTDKLVCNSKLPSPTVTPSGTQFTAKSTADTDFCWHERPLVADWNETGVGSQTTTTSGTSFLAGGPRQRTEGSSHSVQRTLSCDDQRSQGSRAWPRRHSTDGFPGRGSSCSNGEFYSFRVLICTSHMDMDISYRATGLSVATQ